MPKRTTSYHAWLLTQLSDPQTAAAYVNDAINDSPEMLPKVLRNVAEARGMYRVAEEAGVNRENLYRTLSGQGNPTWGTLSSVLKALHLSFRIVPDELYDVVDQPVKQEGFVSNDIKIFDLGKLSIPSFELPPLGISTNAKFANLQPSLNSSVFVSKGYSNQATNVAASVVTLNFTREDVVSTVAKLMVGTKKTQVQAAGGGLTNGRAEAA
jgi:probable addiction module antidote protein